MTFGHPENFQPGTPMSSQSVAPQMFLCLWILICHVWRPMILYHCWNFHCRCGHLNLCNAIIHTMNYVNYSFKLTQSKRTRFLKKSFFVCIFVNILPVVDWIVRHLLTVFFHCFSSLISMFVRSQKMFDCSCTFQTRLIKFTAYDLRLPAFSWCICK